jgi:hypothetical protein
MKRSLTLAFLFLLAISQEDKTAEKLLETDTFRCPAPSRVNEFCQTVWYRFSQDVRKENCLLEVTTGC